MPLLIILLGDLSSSSSHTSGLWGICRSGKSESIISGGDEAVATRLQVYLSSSPLWSLPGSLAIRALGLLENRQLSSPHPCLPLSMPELLISTPGHLLNRALFSAASEGAIRRGQPHRGWAAFIPRCQDVSPGCCTSSQLNGFLGKYRRGPGVQREAGCVPTLDHCVYAKVSHSVGTRRRSWGRGLTSSALPGLQLTYNA